MFGTNIIRSLVLNDAAVLVHFPGSRNGFWSHTAVGHCDAAREFRIATGPVY
jgi:hypothetical protein